MHRFKNVHHLAVLMVGLLSAGASAFCPGVGMLREEKESFKNGRQVAIRARKASDGYCHSLKFLRVSCRLNEISARPWAHVAQTPPFVLRAIGRGRGTPSEEDWQNTQSFVEEQREGTQSLPKARPAVVRAGEVSPSQPTESTAAWERTKSGQQPAPARRVVIRRAPAAGTSGAPPPVGLSLKPKGQMDAAELEMLERRRALAKKAPPPPRLPRPPALLAGIALAAARHLAPLCPASSSLLAAWPLPHKPPPLNPPPPPLLDGFG